MHWTYIGFICLVWFSGALNAQISKRHCRRPVVENGFKVPEKDIYTHESQLSYSCDPGYKPVAESWWAVVTCENGKWSHEPKCIDDKSCLPLLIPNGKPTGEKQPWFTNAWELNIECDTGYTVKDGVAVAVCAGGTWTPVPVCEKKVYACEEPQRKLNAVVVNHKYATIFEAGTVLEYACQDGYSFEKDIPKKTITCSYGQWSLADPCIKKIPSTPEPTTSDDGTQLIKYKCGDAPVIKNGEAVFKTETHIRYQCAAYYTFVGSVVYCLSSGLWSDLPICKENFCQLNTGDYPSLKNVGQIYMSHEESRYLLCSYESYFSYYYALVHCYEGNARVGPC